MIERSDRYLARHRTWIVVAILVASLGVRVAYFLETDTGPCSATERFEHSDMHFFDAWARDIAQGDWLGRRPLHPLHDWHLQVAAIHFRQHPEPIAAETLWNRWYGGTRFHQEPLYPYAIAATYRVLGENAQWVELWQMLLGIASNLLIYFIARRHFSDTVAVVAAALAVGCGPLLFYESVLLRASVLAFAGLLVVQVVEVALDRDSPRGYLVAGAVCGLAVLLKSTFALLALGAVALVLWRHRESGRLARVSAGLIAAGMAICLLPLVVRNLAVQAPPLAISSVAPVTFIGSHAKGHDPLLGFQLQLDATARIMDSGDGRLLPTMLETLRTHPHPGSWIALEARKLAAAWHGFEIPNNVNFYLCRKVSRVLPWLPVNFALIAPLALAGLIASAWTRRAGPLLYLLVLTHLLPLLAFYVLSRFRAPLITALIPFAAAALVWGVEWSLTGHRLRAIVLAGIVVLAALWAVTPRSPRAGPLIRMQDVATAVRYWYLPRSRQALQADDPATAAHLLTECLSFEPALVQELLEGRELRYAHELEFMRAFGELHVETARALRLAGREDEARQTFERGRAIARRGGELGTGPSLAAP